MKIEFDKKGNNFIEITNGTMNNYHILISVLDAKNPLTTIINSVEINFEQLSLLLSDLNISLIKSESKKEEKNDENNK